MLASQAAAASSAVAAESDAWTRLRPATIYKLYIGRSGVDARGIQYLTWSKDEIVKLDNHLQDL